MPAPSVTQIVTASITASLAASQNGFPTQALDCSHQDLVGSDVSFVYIAYPAVALVHTLDSPSGIVRANAASLLVSGQTLTMNHVRGYSVQVERIVPANPASGSCVAGITTLFGSGTFTATDAGILIASSNNVAAAFSPTSSLVLTFAGMGNNLYARVLVWGTIA